MTIDAMGCQTDIARRIVDAGGHYVLNVKCLAPVEPGISADNGWPTLSPGGFHPMTQKRKRLSGPEKIAIVKRYLVERIPISALCDDLRADGGEHPRKKARGEP